MRQFLQFVTEAAISGNQSLKETVIGVEVFSRASAYDSTVDPIVRVEARRLREKLQQYYDRDGSEDPIVVNLPKGGYTPEFEFRAGPPLATAYATAKVSARVPVRQILLWMVAAAFCGAAAVTLWIPARTALPPGDLPHTAAAAKTTFPASLPTSSIAVLPLANLSGDPAEDYLADGLTDELITWLAKFTSLRVISRTSATQYKGTRKTLPQIAKDLGVDDIVEGSVTRSGRQLRITARLFDARLDRELWAEDYKRPAGDILTIESDVARMVLSGVQLALSSREESLLRRQANVDPDAWDIYLKGRYFWNKRTEDGLLKSIGYFKEAVARAPGYAPAWAGLADSWLLLGESRTRPREEVFPEAQEAADRALKLDDDLGEAHASRAALEADRGHWEIAEAEFRRALALSPSYATGHQWYAEGLAWHGRMEEALSEIRRARELDPLSLPVNVQVGYMLFLARRYDEAIAQLRSVIDMDPNFFLAHSDLGHVYEQKGMYAEAIAELEKAAALTNQAPGPMMWLAHVWALAGRKTEARRLRDDLEEPFKQGHLEAPSMALVDLALGEPDRGLTRLREGCAENLVEPLSPTPLFDPLRSNPSFAAVLAHCGKADGVAKVSSPHTP
jgi:TolB-like protein/Flp pilus assembly protein TadD